MTQILGNLSKNIANPSIRSMSTSSICSVPPFVHPSFPLSVQSISVRLFSPSICSVRPSVRLATLSTPSVHSVLSVPLRSSFVPPSICLSVHPLCPSIQTVQFVCLFSPSICSSAVPLSVQFVCPSNPSVHQLSGWQRERQKINTLKLAKQQFCTCIALFVHFFAVGARLQRETSIFHAFFTLLSNWGRERKTTIFLFSF